MNMPISVGSAWLHRLVAATALVFAFALAAVLFDMPVAAAKLSEEVIAHLPHSGVDHPVTAVLLNFRSYDTLLEIGVLLLAVFAALVPVPASGPPGTQVAITTNPLLLSLVRALAPLMLLIAIYLLWAGSHSPGGAFQAGAVLAAAGVLLRLAGMMPISSPPNLRWRAALLAGFLVFMAVGLAALSTGGALLEYPREWAGQLILLIEMALTASIGLTLLSLFTAAPSASKENVEP